jgi:hypothetical protein
MPAQTTMNLGQITGVINAGLFLLLALMAWLRPGPGQHLHGRVAAWPSGAGQRVIVQGVSSSSRRWQRSRCPM